MGAGVVQFLLHLVYRGVRRRDKAASVRMRRKRSSDKHGAKLDGEKRGKKWHRAVFFLLTQFLLPFAVLLVSSLLLNESMMWTVVGMIVSMVACFIARIVLTFRRAKRGLRRN